jgi:hypothetical protein
MIMIARVTPSKKRLGIPTNPKGFFFVVGVENLILPILAAEDSRNVHVHVSSIVKRSANGVIGQSTS